MEYNKSLDKNLRAYELIFKIENSFRSFVLNKMNKESWNWWDELNAKNFKKINDIKMSNEEAMFAKMQKQAIDEKSLNSLDLVLMHDIYYTNIWDLYLIIKRFWNNNFKNVITGITKEELRERFSVTNKIRNKAILIIIPCFKLFAL